MRRSLLALVMAATLASAGTAWSACGATLGASAIPLGSDSVMYSLGVDGTVRTAAAHAAPVEPGSVDATGRYTATWTQSRKGPLTVTGHGTTTTIASRVLTSPVWSPDGRSLALVSPNDQRHCERGSQLVVVDAAAAR